MDLTGIGLYTLKEAEHLTGAQSREVSQWLFGYKFKDRTSPPLWRTQLAGLEVEGKFIGFRDLLEVRVVKAFIQHNVPLQSFGPHFTTPPICSLRSTHSQRIAF